MFILTNSYYDWKAVSIDSDFRDEFKLKSKDRKTAIELSIQKWKFVLDYLKSDNVTWLLTPWANTCSLCEYSENYGGNCKNCPVAKKVNTAGCYNTPYYEIDDRLIPQNAQSIKSVENEISFLEDLLVTDSE